MADDLSTDSFKATDAGAAGLILAAALFAHLRRTNALSKDDADGIATRAYETLLKAGSPGGAHALQRVLGAKLKSEEA